jgi:aminopeptidase N
MDVVTGGRRVFERVDGDRLRVEYRLEHPGRYVTAAVGRMVDAASLQAGAVELHAITVSRLRSRAEPALRELQSMLSFYEREFGPCPYEHLNLVLAEARAPGGHSPPGMLFLQTRPALLRTPLRDDPTNFSDVPGFFMAHEAAHQWWGHGVAAENYHERWISESFAQYAAALWIRESRGEDAFQDVLARMQRWALRESHEGPIRLGFRLGHLKGDRQIFRAIVYDKGALVLHMLHGLVGDAAFRQALQDVQTRHRYQKIGVDEVRRALERASGRDLRPYFDAWLDGTALPELRVSERRADRRVSVEVAAKNLPGPLPLELTVVHERGRQQERVTLPPGGGSFSFVAPSRVRHVDANDDRGLLAIVKR